MPYALFLHPECRHSSVYLNSMLYDTLHLNRTKIQEHMLQHEPPYAQINLDTDEKAAHYVYDTLLKQQYKDQRVITHIHAMSRHMAMLLYEKARKLFWQSDRAKHQDTLTVLFEASRLGWVRQQQVYDKLYLHPNIKACMRLSTLPLEQALLKCIDDVPTILPQTYIKHLQVRELSYSGQNVSPWSVMLLLTDEQRYKLAMIGTRIMIPRASALSAAIEWCVEQSDMWQQFVNDVTEGVVIP